MSHGIIVFFCLCIWLMRIKIFTCASSAWTACIRNRMAKPNLNWSSGVSSCRKRRYRETFCPAGILFNGNGMWSYVSTAGRRNVCIIWIFNPCTSWWCITKFMIWSKNVPWSHGAMESICVLIPAKYSIKKIVSFCFALCQEILVDIGRILPRTNSDLS